MPEAAVVEPVVEPVTPPADPPSLGWRAGLPDDLKQNTDLANYKTVGDFTKDALSWKGKVSELEGKLGESIPKLPDDATDEDRNTYYDALGRPKTPNDYVLEGEDKNAPEFNAEVRKLLHDTGQTPQQALALNKWWNKFFDGMVKHQQGLAQAEYDAAAQKLKSELGDKYDTNVELAKRLWKQHGDGEFDIAFANSPSRFGTIRLLLKLASLTGEDTSPQGQHSGSAKELDSTAAWMNMYKNPVGGKK